MDRSSQPVAAAFAPMQERQGLRSRATRRLDLVLSERAVSVSQDARSSFGASIWLRAAPTLALLGGLDVTYFGRCAARVTH
jgi:hypothetical protein